MGLLDNTTHQAYYQGNDHGNYQFTSLDTIINQFEVAYVGENKIIPKIKRADIAFHAQRALQELSFDTFKSCKSQQIDVPASLKMPLPHDYVNYTKVSWVDSAGIKHPLYHTNDTNNPFQIRQSEDGLYHFDPLIDDTGILENSNFSSDLTSSWTVISPALDITHVNKGATAIDNGVLKFSQHTRNDGDGYNNGVAHTVYQAIDVTGVDSLDISALGIADTVSFVSATNVGTLRFGLSTILPVSDYIYNTNNSTTNPITPNAQSSIFDLVNSDGNASYMEWVGPAAVGSTTSTETILNIDVSAHTTIYAVIVSFVDFTMNASAQESALNLDGDGIPMLANSIDNLVVIQTQASDTLITTIGNEKNSSTWNSYKGGAPSENQDDYIDDTYWSMSGRRYGLDPQHAQANGSFYIDCRLGKINFSSNISGKTVILDYISDSLGTDAEMQVHKFAEEAMYKYIAHAILSTSSYGQQLVHRLTREKFAAVRKAKLRLSNLKLEELTQILRGKSKQIKH